MKNLILLIVTILVCSNLLNAQVDQSAINKDVKNIKKEESSLKKEKKVERKELRKLKGTEVSFQAKQQFQIDFPKITDERWNRSTNFDEAVFVKNGKEIRAYYDEQSKLVGTSNAVTFAELPKRAQKFITDKYKDYSIGPSIFFDDNEYNETDMVLYGTQFDDEDSYFVELVKNGKKIVVRSNSSGDVEFFKDM